MAILNPSDLTFNGKEIREMNEAVVEAVYANPLLTDFHTFVGGIKTKQQIVIFQKFAGLTGKGSGGCNKSADPFEIAMAEKFWIPATVSNNIKICYTELEGIFVIWGTQNGLKKSDLTKTQFWDFLIDYFTNALIEEILRISWFSDVDAADVDASPAGELTSGTNPAYFNKIDGFWKQIYAIVAATPARKTSDLASKNGQATYALQLFNSTDTTNKVVTNALQNVRFGADSRLRSNPTAFYLVTKSVADQYERELMDANKTYTTERLENGITVLKSGGLDLVTFEFQDRIIEAYYDNGTKYVNPHRILLMSKDNFQIGTEAEDTFTQINSIYDEVEEYNYLRSQYEIDAKVVEDWKIQVAY